MMDSMLPFEARCSAPFCNGFLESIIGEEALLHNAES